MSLKNIFWKNHKKIMKSLPESIVFSCAYQDKERIRKGAPQCTCRKGSLTLEAAVIIPLLTCFFTLLLFFFRVMQVQLQVQDALFSTARTLAVYAGVEEDVSDVKYLALAKGMLAIHLSDDENISRYISGETLGISLMESEFDGNEIFLKANYRMKFPVELLGKQYVYLHQQACYRKWTGWKDEQDKKQENGVYVYVTETGKAYHQTNSCPYLDLSIQMVETTGISAIRNKGGQKYRACSACAKKNGKKEEVYITSYGECYHYSISCSGLKRTVYRIKLEEIGGRSRCSKCWM